MAGERNQVDSVLYHAADPYKNLEQTIALGLLVLRKYDRADEQFGSSAIPAQLATCANFTQNELEEFTSQSAQILTQFAVNFAVPEPERPGWRAAWGIPLVIGFLSAFLYSIFLIVIAVIAKLGGHDLIDIAREALKPN